MIHKLLREIDTSDIHPGAVMEWHISPEDGAPMYMHHCPIEDFVNTWGYSMGIEENPFDGVFGEGCYVGIVHDDGAYVVELTPQLLATSK